MHIIVCFFVPRKPFVSVNVVVRISFVLLCWPFWFSGTGLLLFLFLFCHFPRNDHLNRNKITKNVPKHLPCSIFVQRVHLCVWVYFLFFPSFCYSVDNRAVKQIAGEAVPVNHGFRVRSASLLAFRKRLCSSVRGQIEHWWAVGTCTKKKMAVLLIRERAFGVRKTGSVLHSSSRRKYIYLFV